MNLRVALLAVLIASPAIAQSVQQSGTVTRGHVAVWITNGVIGDGGSSSSSPITSLGATNNGGCGIGINSALPTAGAYEQLCFGINAAGTAVISAQNYAGAPIPSITFNINGAAQGFPVVTPLPVVVGNVACFAAVGGTLTDCGASPSTFPLVAGTTPTNGYASGQILGSTGSVLSVYSINGSGNVVLTTGAALVAPTATSLKLAGNFILAPGETIVQPAVPASGSTVPWTAISPNGSNPVTGTTISGVLQSAVNTALATFGTAGYDLKVDGCNTAGSGSNCLFTDTTTLNFPPAQGKQIVFGSVLLNGVTIDSCVMCNYDFAGQMGVGGGSGGVTIKPTNPELPDGITGIVDSHYNFGSLSGNANTAVPLTIDITTSGISQTNFSAQELAYGLTNALLIKSPTNASGAWQNTTNKYNHAHDLSGGAGSTYFQIGNATPFAGTSFKQNQYDLVAVANAGNENLFDTYGSLDRTILRGTGFTSGVAVNFHSGACGNKIELFTDQSGPNVNDNGGCSFPNQVSINGIPQYIVGTVGLLDASYVRLVPTTGFTQTIPGTVWHYLIDPAGTLATGTFTMPTFPYQGATLDLIFSQQITALTLSPGGGQSIVGLTSGTIPKGGLIECIYRFQSTTWYCSWNSNGISASSPTFSGTVTMPDGGTWGSGGINGSNIGTTTAGTGRFSSVTSLGGISTGVLGSAQGSLTIFNSVVGTTIITNAVNGGNPTIQTPNNNGTIAVGATSPITLGAANGQIGCATCLTANQTVTLSGIVTGSGTTAITTSFGSFASSALSAALTDETGTGVAVFGTSPTVSSPTFTGIVTGPDSGIWTSSGLRGLATLYVGSVTGYAMGGVSAATTETIGSGQAGSISILRYNGAGTSGAFNVMASSRGAAPGTFSTLQSGDGLGSFLFGGDNGTNYAGLGAAFTCNASGTWTLTSNPATCVIQTTPSAGIVPLTALTFDSTQNATFAAQIFVANATSDAGLTDSTACLRTSNGQVLKGSGTLGICLGTSSARYKTDIQDLGDGLAQIVALAPKSFYLDAEHGDPNKRMYGFLAEDCAHVLPTLTGFDDHGRPNTCDYLGVVPVLVKAVQELKYANDNLRAELDSVVARGK